MYNPKFKIKTRFHLKINCMSYIHDDYDLRNKTPSPLYLPKRPIQFPQKRTTTTNSDLENQPESRSTAMDILKSRLTGEKAEARVPHQVLELKTLKEKYEREYQHNFENLVDQILECKDPVTEPIGPRWNLLKTYFELRLNPAFRNTCPEMLQFFDGSAAKMFIKRYIEEFWMHPQNVIYKTESQSDLLSVMIEELEALKVWSCVFVALRAEIHALYPIKKLDPQIINAGQLIKSLNLSWHLGDSQPPTPPPGYVPPIYDDTPASDSDSEDKTSFPDVTKPVIAPPTLDVVTPPPIPAPKQANLLPTPIRLKIRCLSSSISIPKPADPLPAPIVYPPVTESSVIPISIGESSSVPPYFMEFFNTECVKGYKEWRTLNTDFYKAYENWRSRSKAPKMAKKAIGTALKNLSVRIQESNGKTYYHIRLRSYR